MLSPKVRRILLGVYWCVAGALCCELGLRIYTAARIRMDLRPYPSLRRRIAVTTDHDLRYRREPFQQEMEEFPVVVRGTNAAGEKTDVVKRLDHRPRLGPRR